MRPDVDALYIVKPAMKAVRITKLRLPMLAKFADLLALSLPEKAIDATASEKVAYYLAIINIAENPLKGLQLIQL